MLRRKSNDSNADTKLPLAIRRRISKLGAAGTMDLVRIVRNRKNSDEARSEAAYLLRYTELLEGLSRAERRQTVGVLLKALCEDKPRLAWGAALALGDIGDKGSCKPLRDVVRSSLSSETRQAAVVAIRDLGDHKAVGVLARVLTEANEPSSMRGGDDEALSR